MNAQVEQAPKQGAAIGGWVCLGCGVLLMWMSPFLFLLYAPLYLAAFILGIVAMAQKRVGQGLAILVLSIILPIAGVSFFAKKVSDAIDDAKKPLAERAKATAPTSGADSTPTATGKSQDQEKLDYVASSIELYDVTANMYETYGGKEPGVEFKLKNKGDRSLDMVEVTVYFKDASGATIAEENYRPVFVSEYNFGGDNKPLKAGYIWQQERDKFYKAKNVPTEWKVGAVEAKITDIRFTPSKP